MKNESVNMNDLQKPKMSEIEKSEKDFFKTVKLSEVKRGSFVRQLTKCKMRKKTFVFIKHTKKYGYELQNYEDISDFRYIKKDVDVAVEFTY